ncbi:hypothetical protein DPMN_070236 [Dreissena polymorpha]|uniref:Uncharacterized protein n=1 Tax=Dreissena polymorpha TaxID=45954 RepID=A0A9D3Z5L4_DREPO|nr:hypothetical protein DPMN_070236 [Dreissena polymorpha]
MRSLKNTGRHSHSSGNSEVMNNPWTFSAHVTSEYNSAMQDFTELAYTINPKHKDSTEVLIKGDASDLEKMQTKITNCSPYTAYPLLKNIVNWIMAGSDVNVHALQEVRNKIIRYIVGKSTT